MNRAMKRIVLAMCLCLTLVSLPTTAGVDDELAAANERDFKTALREWRLLAEQGNARAQAQAYLRLMHAEGDGVPKDYNKAVAWHRKATQQEDAAAQHNLGVMYVNGQGVPESSVVAYALYNLSAAVDPSDGNTATNNRFPPYAGWVWQYRRRYSG
jgi:TPR repeat protein